MARCGFAPNPTSATPAPGRAVGGWVKARRNEAASRQNHEGQHGSVVTARVRLGAGQERLPHNAIVLRLARSSSGYTWRREARIGKHEAERA